MADTATQPWTDKYVGLLTRYVAQPCDEVLAEVERLGRELLEQGVAPDSVAAGHGHCLERLLAENPRGPAGLVIRAQALLSALLGAYGRSYAQQRVLNERLREHAERLRQAVAALRESEQELLRQRGFAESLIDTAQAVVLVLDARGKIVLFNRYTQELLGCTLEEVRGRDWFELAVPEHCRRDVRRRFERAIREKRVRGARNPVLARDGGERIFEWSDCLQYDTDGDVVGLLAIGFDVSEREQAERALRQAHLELERRVEERTAELQAANRELKREVEARRRVEQFLRRSEERYRAIVEDQTEFICRWKAGCIHTFVNDAYCRCLGRTRKELLGSSFLPFIPEWERQRLLAHFASLTPEHPVASIEHEVIVADGSIRYHLWTNRAIFDRDGNLVEYQSVGHDITERRRAELEAQRRAAILEAVRFAAECFLRRQAWEETIEEAFALLGAAADVCRVYLFENHLGPRGEQLTSQRYEWCRAGVQPQIDNPGLQSVDWIAAGFESWVQTLGSGGVITGLVRDFPQPIREILAAQDIKSIAVVPVFVGDEWWGFLGFDETRRERQWSQAEIQALEAAADTLGAAIYRSRTEEEVRVFKTIAETAGYGVGLATVDGTLVYVNSSFARMHGYERDELIGRPLSVLHSRQQMPRVLELNNRLVEEGAYVGEEVWHKHKDGHVFPTLMSAVLIRDRHGTPQYFAATAIDITLRLEAEREARRRNEELAHVARLAVLGEMVSGLAHELNQPLAAVLYYARGCSRRLDAGTMDCHEMRRIIERVAGQAERAAAVVERLRSFVRKGGRHAVRLDLNEVVRDAVRFIEHELERANVRLELELSHEALQVHADEVQLQQVVLNLVSNAVEAQQKVDPENRLVRIRTYRPDDGKVACRVSDRGCGIDRRHRGRVFEPFFTTKAKGMGMGLAISRSIIEAHGGRIRVDDNPEGGAAFEFILSADEPGERDG